MAEKDKDEGAKQNGIFVPSWTAPIILFGFITLATVVANWTSTSTRLGVLEDRNKELVADMAQKATQRDLQTADAMRRIASLEQGSERVTRIEEQIKAVSTTLQKIEVLLDSGRIRFEGKPARS